MSLKNTKRSIFVVVSLLLGLSAAPCYSNEKKIAAMSLDDSLSKLIDKHSAFEKFKKDKSDGLKIINGPVKFQFIAENKINLEFNDAKLILFKIADSNIKYIHVFPQQSNLSMDEFQGFLKSLEKKLVKANWLKQLDSVLQNNSVFAKIGISDYAHYRLQLTDQRDKIKYYEVVLTTFIDVNVACMESHACKNHFIRLGFNPV